MLKPTFIVIIIVIFAVACFKPSDSNHTESQIGTKQIVGTWLLKTINNKESGAIGLKSYEITFNEDETVDFIGITLSNIEAKGTGTWIIEGEIFQYKIGENQGNSQITFKNGILSFTPDPVLLDKGNKATSTFVRKS